jgi:hypothetical protein
MRYRAALRPASRQAVGRRYTVPAGPSKPRKGMIPKSGYRFSDKIMPETKEKATSLIQRS